MKNTDTKFKNIDKCRISDSEKLEPIIDLGLHGLANSPKKNQDDYEEQFPLSTSYCEKSSLFQLDQVILKPLYDNYVWVTGTSKQALDYSYTFYNKVLEYVRPGKNDLIVEIASNDGTFLIPFLKNNFKKVVGVDPAVNISNEAIKNNIPTIIEYWSNDLANKMNQDPKYGKAKVIFARNVIFHAIDLYDNILGIHNALDDDGVGIIEFHSASKIQKELHYDSIYHEHVIYFSIKSITYLLNRFNLNTFHVEKSPTSGGSLAIYFSKNKRNKTKELIEEEDYEERENINTLNSWKNFADRVIDHKSKIKKMMSDLSEKKIIGFGSSARSQTFLKYCDIYKEQLSCIIDNNKLKQNLFTPTTSIPIVDFKTGMSHNPNVILILAYNFKDEIIEQCRNHGFNGEFLMPLPYDPEII